MIGAQTINTNANADPVCDGFAEVMTALPANMCEVDIAFVLGVITNADAVVVDQPAVSPAPAPTPDPCADGDYTVEIIIDGVVIQSHVVSAGADVTTDDPAGAMTMFAAGEYTVEYKATNCLGFMRTCELVLDINPDPDQVLDVLACNNQIQASLSVDCEVEITSDMMLEGNSPCESGYSFEIEDASGTAVMGTTIMTPGTYSVTVTDADGINSCWGTVVAEDKIPPVITCGSDGPFTCTDDLTPGGPLESGENIEGVAGPEGLAWTNSDSPIASDSVVCVVFNFDDMNAGLDASILDLTLDLDILHTNITDLKAILISPSGDTINVFTTPLGGATNPDCQKDDIMVTFSDDGLTDYNQLDVDPTCRLLTQPSVLGSFKPEQSFGSLVGGSAEGDFKLVITDCNPSMNAGSVRGASLFVRMATGDTIPFPTLGTYTADPSSGEGCYTIVHPDGDCGPARACYTDVIVNACDGGIFQRVERTWVVWDKSGNQATEVCVFNVLGSSICDADGTGFGDIIMPRNFDGLSGNPFFTCQDIFAMDDNGNPDPSVTGRPLDGGSTNMEFCGNIEMTYKDTRIDICTGSYKIIREWLLIDWCQNGQPKTFNQIIKVTDERPPITTCRIEDCFQVPITDAYSCTVDFDVPAPIVLNECGGYTWSVSYLPASQVPGFDADPYDLSVCLQPDNDLTAGLFIPVDVTRTDQDSTPITITGLPLGQVWIRYRVIDDCGNESPSGGGACEIRVVDETKPTAVCDEHTVVSLGLNCEAEIRAKTFDDLSWDNCGEIVLYEAKRDSDPYGPTVRFNKADLGNPVDVLLQVTDQAGNTNECWSTVRVQDKFQPIFTSTPDDVTISCDFTDDQLQAVIGTVTAEDNCPGCFRIDGPLMDAPSQNSCGEGSVLVSWELFDINQVDSDGNPIKVNTASQRITFENSDPFDIDDINWPGDRTDLMGCGADTDPSSTGEPTYSDRQCDLIAVSHEDLVFFEVEDACLKILRTWTIIDWCQHNENVVPVTGKWTHIQVLKVTDSEGPVLTNGNGAQFCADETCDAGYAIDLIATDNCTPVDEILWSYTIETDGTIVDQNAGITVDSLLNLSGNLPVGVHNVTVILEDGCGNISDPFTFDITINDCKEPTPYCFSSTTTVVMPSTGSIEIWASDYNIASTDQCPGDLTFSFSSNPSDANLTLTCADLRDGVRRILELEMWVHDAAGNSDFCTIKLDLQDNGTGEGACPDTLSPSASISGFIFTEQNEMVNNVAVQVTSAQPEYPINFTTSNTGDYTFNNLLTGNSYDVSSHKDDDHINGVSTLDIVLIQKHILGLILLDSPYKVIAADADNNQIISGADLVSIRRLVLGLTTIFPNGQDSWRFIDEDQSFSNQFNPFPFNENLSIGSLDYNENNMNFMAVKIGDVNENVNPTAFETHIAEVRSNKTVEFSVENKAIEAGDYVSIPVTAQNFEEIIGFQFTLDFDAAGMLFTGVSKAALDITEANLGLADVDRGLIAVSWNDIQGNSYDADEVLFTLDFKANTDIELSESLALNSRVTNAEAYASDLSMVNAKLLFGDEESTFEVTQFELYQNSPNPFNEETTIGFDLPASSEAVLSVYDVTGKRVIRIVEDYSKGYNEISLNTTELGITGVMYYTLETEGFTATKKMVGVK